MLRNLMKFFHEFNYSVPLNVSHDVMFPHESINPEPVTVGRADFKRHRIRMKLLVLLNDGDAEGISLKRLSP